ncbi:MAG: hypothetical protein RMJ52_06325 [Gemmataceae bacterium]|nr:hypothetical protein [Anaerolineales bacterium]MDW8264934.1 hypothetical protein [Gemmataceae bacterium]
MRFLGHRVNDAERRRLKELLKALRSPCKYTSPNNSSWLINHQFEEEFRSILLIHHYFIGSPLFQDSFESAFIAACQHRGFSLKRAPDGQRFWDVEVDTKNEKKKISLKSSKAKSLKSDVLYISKLTEAAWIQDCRTAKKRQERTQELFSSYCAEVETIVQLRYFSSQQQYELVEVPVALFKAILKVPTKHFSADGPTINIPIGKDPPDFTLKLDRSDAKITVTNINKKLCTVHGTWQM